ncbi:MAG: glycosyltransferase [Oscillatoria princeps RMCB-10]|jgi:glycosyltransferase involved in cell wall biosynthesis|nr:glycosyltransferase [Oscillatoria princeps RMCB-10]
MAPSISIIITTYNRERYLRLAIESVLAQTKRDFELIIWDDGSTDNSLNIARNFANLDQRVKAIAAPHQGRAPSLKAAHAICEGTYVGWVDSDDLLAPTALEETAAFLDANPKVGLVYTDYLVIDSNSNVLNYGQRCRIPYSKHRLLLDFMTFHFRLMRRDAYQEAGGIDESMELSEDYDLCLRLSEITEIKHLEKPLYFYRTHADSTTNRQLELIRWSAEAINRALKRRGLAETHELDVQIVGRYFLRQKDNPSTRSGGRDARILDARILDLGF